jgi:hypothetical protein
MDVDGVELLLQYGCLNFQAKRGGQRAKLTVAVKNKWSRGHNLGSTVKFL